MAVKTYDPKAISVIIGAQPMKGFADGDFVGVERNEDNWTLTVGADGESTRSKNANKSGKITITLLGSSESNDYLSQLAAADELSGNGTFTGLIKDNRGRSLYSFATGWITRTANATYAKESPTREWVIETDELVTYVGGNY